jgi:two-component system chemotaxis response regulator CheB
MTVNDTPLRALVVQESSTGRRKLVEALQRDGDISVVGPAATAAEAIRQTQVGRPDVIVLDLQLADGGSLHAIEQIMAGNPTPILVLSRQIDDRNSPPAVQALLAGALDALPTPASWSAASEADLRRSVRQLRKVLVIRHPRGSLARTVDRPPTTGNHRPVVAVGASTGGPSALADLLSGLGGLQAPVLVVQHLHADFTAGLLTWMSRASALPVEMAEHRHIVEPGHVYLAPSRLHLRLGPDFRLELTAVPASLHRPSVNQLFHSVAESAGSDAIGVLLTGMGEDGAQGLLDIRAKGGRTMAQDEASSAVFGMPRAAQRLGAVTDLLPLNRMAQTVCRAVAEICG